MKTPIKVPGQKRIENLLVDRCGSGLLGEGAGYMYLDGTHPSTHGWFPADGTKNVLRNFEPWGRIIHTAPAQHGSIQTRSKHLESQEPSISHRDEAVRT